jgi:ATP-binding cassette subfamily F protein 3
MEKREAEQPPPISAPPPAQAGNRAPNGRKIATPGEPRAASREPRTAEAPKSRTREAKRADAEARQRKSREVAPLRARLKEAEAEIARIEARVRELTDQMANPDLYKDGERARDVARERKDMEERVGSLYSKWEELTVRLEAALAETGP